MILPENPQTNSVYAFSDQTYELATIKKMTFPMGPTMKKTLCYQRSI